MDRAGVAAGCLGVRQLLCPFGVMSLPKAQTDPRIAQLERILASEEFAGPGRLAASSVLWWKNPWRDEEIRSRST